MEAIDVEEGRYFAFDGNGTRLDISTNGWEVKLTPSEVADKSRLIEMLKEYYGRVSTERARGEIAAIKEDWRGFLFYRLLEGATGAAAGYSCPTLTGLADLLHGGQSNLINTMDIQSGYNAISSGGTLSVSDYSPTAPH